MLKVAGLTGDDRPSGAMVRDADAWVEGGELLQQRTLRHYDMGAWQDVGVRRAWHVEVYRRLW